MQGNRWTEDEFYLAMHLYYRIPFGRQHSTAPEIIELAKAIGRTSSSVAMRLNNYTACDPSERARGVKGLEGGGQACKDFWNKYHSDLENSAVHAEQLWLEVVEKKRPLSSQSQPITETDEEYSGEQEAIRPVRVRLAQGYFRRIVLASYENRCCVSEIPITELLIASHIQPWATHQDNRVKPSNGLCLSRIHDAAFDQGLIGFDEDYRLLLSKRIKEFTTVQLLKDAFVRFEGSKLRLPLKNFPDPEAMKWHREKRFAA